MKCGGLLGAMFSPAPQRLDVACPSCIAGASDHIGVTPSSDADWEKVVAELKKV